MALAIFLLPTLVLAQVIYPNRGGTGNSTLPGNGMMLMGNGISFDLKRLIAGDNVTISTSTGQIIIAASLEGGGLATTDIDTEAELEALVTDVSNFFTNNDGILADDDVSDDNLDDLANTSLADPNADELVFWDDSAGQFRFIDDFGGLSIATTSLSIVRTGDWSGTLDGYEAAALLDDTTLSEEQVEDFVGGMLGGTETLITVTYQDVTGDIDFVVESNLSNFTNDAGFLTAVVTGDITDGTILQADLDSDVVAVDGDFLQYDSTGDNFTWRDASEVKSDLSLNNVENTALSTWAGSSNITTLGTIGTGVWQGTVITDSYISDTITVGASGSVSDSALSANVSLLGSSISTGEITDDTITHADIADADQAMTMCIYIEDPTADDDLQSIWANKTSNDLLLTELWAESDQTVAFDLGIDDGTVADVNGTDITPAAGEAEDTSLSGDTTLAAGEELDLLITSVTNSPTWVSICWTGQWVD